MQGFVEYLEPTARALRSPRSVWTRRFARLDNASQALELFADPSLQQRVARLELAAAEVASADELGELLAGKPTDHVLEAHARRFVFRVTCRSGRDHGVHNFCPVEASEDGNAAAGRAARDHWIRALRTAAAALGPPTAPVDVRDVHAQLATYLDTLCVSAHVTSRRVDAADPHARGQYELTVQAWTLQRELAAVDARTAPQWHVLEYASTWRVATTSAALADLDAQLRLLGHDLHDLTLPSFHGVRAFLHRGDNEQENARRVALVDAYWQQLLRMPDWSMIGSEGGTRIDAFLEISRHVAGLKQVETASGERLYWRTKRVVPWRERQVFEQLLQRHEALERVNSAARAKVRTASDVPRQSSRDSRESRDKRDKSHSRHASRATPPLPEPEPVSQKVAVVKDPEPVDTPESVDSVHERIARIGHKLLVEAFAAPSPRRDTIDKQ